MIERQLEGLLKTTRRLFDPNFDIFVRICADSPLIDYRLVDKGIEYFLNGDYDLVTNSLPRTFPAGQGVEVMDSKLYLNTYGLMQKKEDLEHVTRYFYENNKNFRIHNFNLNFDYSNIRLCVDTKEDLERLKKIIEKFEMPHWNYSVMEMINLYEIINIE